MKRGWYFKLVIEDDEVYLHLMRKVFGILHISMASTEVSVKNLLKKKVELIEDLEKEGMY